MSSYFFGLYFSEKVSRQQLQQKIQRLPDVKKGPEGPDHVWVGEVHLVFHDVDLEPMFRDIHQHTGMTTGKFSLGVGVHNRSQESTERMLDIILALSDSHDFVAVYESESLMLWQKGRELTVDTVGLGQPTQDYLASKRPCHFAAIGPLLEG